MEEIVITFTGMVMPLKSEVPLLPLLIAGGHGHDRVDDEGDSADDEASLFVILTVFVLSLLCQSGRNLPSDYDNTTFANEHLLPRSKDLSK